MFFNIVIKYRDDDDDEPKKPPKATKTMKAKVEPITKPLPPPPHMTNAHKAFIEHMLSRQAMFHHYLNDPTKLKGPKMANIVRCQDKHCMKKIA